MADGVDIDMAEGAQVVVAKVIDKNQSNIKKKY